jgi:hypothetical protein
MMPARKGSDRPGNQLVALVKDAPRPKPNERGRMLDVEAIRELLPRRADGTKVTRWYVNHSFFPAGKHKMGRTSWWWELEVYEHLETQRVEAAP